MIALGFNRSVAITSSATYTFAFSGALATEFQSLSRDYLFCNSNFVFCYSMNY